MQPRAAPCHDCAFRPGSPERSGDERYAHSGEGELAGIAAGRNPFVCHQGMRRVLRWRHPSGAVHEEPTPDRYDPPETRYAAMPVVWKADGTPADLCAGHCAARRAMTQRETP